MDSKGHLRNLALEEALKDDEIAVPHESAVQLRDMNRRARRVYYSERRRGATETEALDAAVRSYRS